MRLTCTFSRPSIKPTLRMEMDRTRIQSVGLQAKDVAQNVLVSLSSSFQTAPAFWLDPKNGVSYNVAVQTPQYRVDSWQALQNTPINAGPGTVSADSGQLDHHDDNGTPGGRFALQRATDDQRVCDGEWSRPRRCLRRRCETGERYSSRNYPREATS